MRREYGVEANVGRPQVSYRETIRGTAQKVDDSSAEAYAVGQLVEAVAAKTGKVDNATIISSLHAGSWPTILGNLAWSANGSPTGTFNRIGAGFSL